MRPTLWYVLGIAQSRGVCGMTACLMKKLQGAMRRLGAIMPCYLQLANIPWHPSDHFRCAVLLPLHREVALGLSQSACCSFATLVLHRSAIPYDLHCILIADSKTAKTREHASW